MRISTYFLDLEALLVELAILPGLALGLRGGWGINIHSVGHDRS